MTRDRTPDVAVKFLEDVAQRWWDCDTGTNRETQTVGLAWSVIRILAENHHFGPGE